MEKSTLKQMEEILIVHETAEFDNDLDAVMSTLTATPVYELPSIGWHIQGAEGVRELYKRWLTGAEKRNVWAEKRVQAYSMDENALIRDAYVYYDDDNGKRVTGRYSTAISFDGGLISGERMFMETPFAKLMYDILGADFADVPGVSTLEEVAPPPVDRLDRAAAHAANPHH